MSDPFCTPGPIPPSTPEMLRDAILAALAIHDPNCERQGTALRALGTHFGEATDAEVLACSLDDGDECCDMTNSFDLRDEELATILAALRFYQSHGLAGTSVPDAILKIGTNNGEVAALDIDAIDTLCEWLNHGGKTTP